MFSVPPLISAMVIFRYRFAVLVVLTRCCTAQNKQYVWVEGSFLSTVPPLISAKVIFRYRFAVLVVLARCCTVQNKQYVWAEGSCVFCHFCPAAFLQPLPWLYLPSICIIGGSCQKYFYRDKTHLVATELLSQQKLFVATKLLSRVCRDKHTFLMTKDVLFFSCFFFFFSRQTHV